MSANTVKKTSYYLLISLLTCTSFNAIANDTPKTGLASGGAGAGFGDGVQVSSLIVPIAGVAAAGLIIVGAGQVGKNATNDSKSNTNAVLPTNPNESIQSDPPAGTI